MFEKYAFKLGNLLNPFWYVIVLCRLFPFVLFSLLFFVIK